MSFITAVIVVYLLMCWGFSALLKVGYWHVVLAGIILVLVSIIIVVISLEFVPETLQRVTGLYYNSAVT